MIAALARRLLPFSARLAIKRNLLHRFLKGLTLTKQDKQLIAYFKNAKVTDAILLSGYPKSGNTWIRFVVFNYFNILNNHADRTFTYQELQDIQPHVVNDAPSFTKYFRAPETGFPVFYRTHVPYRGIYDYFDKVIYIHRNPLDVMVSAYHFWCARDVPFDYASPADREKFMQLDVYVQSHIHSWILYHKTTLDKCDAPMCYETMRQQPYQEFSVAFERIGIDFDEDVLLRAVELSSFENIKQMGKETGQEHGHASPEEFKGKFMRSGNTRQYVGLLDPETIKQTQRLMDEYGIDVDL